MDLGADREDTNEDIGLDNLCKRDAQIYISAASVYVSLKLQKGIKEQSQFSRANILVMPVHTCENEF